MSSWVSFLNCYSFSQELPEQQYTELLAHALQFLHLILTLSHSQMTLPDPSELEQAGVRNPCLLKPSFLRIGKAEQHWAAKDGLHLSDLAVDELSPLHGLLHSLMSRANPFETETHAPQ